MEDRWCAYAVCRYDNHHSNNSYHHVSGRNFLQKILDVPGDTCGQNVSDNAVRCVLTTRSKQSSQPERSRFQAVSLESKGYLLSNDS